MARLEYHTCPIVYASVLQRCLYNQLKLVDAISFFRGKIDYSQAWELNEKVIDYIFFSNEDIDHHEDSGISFERMSKYNLIRGEAFISGECVSVIEDSGFTNVEQVITRLLSSLHDNIPRPSKVQIKITNLDKGQIQLYQRVF